MSKPIVAVKNMLSAVALAMLVAGLPAVAVAGEKVDKKLNVDPRAEVEIDIVRGKVQVEGWDQPVVHVEGTLDDKTEAFIFESSGKRVQIKVKLPNQLRNGGASDLRIKVPQGASVETDFVSTDLQISNISGEVDAETVSGEIKANRLSHEVKLESVSGDIELRGAGKRVRLESVSGNINAVVTAEQLQAESVSGDVFVQNEGKLKSLKAESVSGNVTVDSALGNDIDASLSAISGNIKLLARGEVNARIDVSTGPGGDITNDLTSDKPDRSMVGSEELNLRLGDGGGRIEMSVVSGEITLGKK